MKLTACAFTMTMIVAGPVAAGVATPTVVIAGKAPVDVLGQIAGICMSKQWVLDQSVLGQVRCSERLGFADSVTERMMLARPLQEGPYRSIVFQAAPYGSGTILQAKAQFDGKLDNGHLTIDPITDPKSAENVQQILDSIRDRLSNPAAP